VGEKGPIEEKYVEGMPNAKRGAGERGRGKFNRTGEVSLGKKSRNAGTGGWKRFDQRKGKKSLGKWGGLIVDGLGDGGWGKGNRGGCTGREEELCRLRE